MDTIVVGVDGSNCARAALEFAISEAALRGARLRMKAGHSKDSRPRCSWKRRATRP
jgi:nucleotide-binding universal stress UspA family protein